MRFGEDLDSLIAILRRAMQLRLGMNNMNAGNPLLDHMPMGYLGVRPVVQAASAAVQPAER